MIRSCLLVDVHAYLCSTDPEIYISIDWFTQETAAMFQHLDTNGDGAIDLAEFTRFCLEVRAARPNVR